MAGIIHPSFRVFSRGSRATAEQLARLESHFGTIPADYRQIAEEDDLEMIYNNDKYLRIWNPYDCIEIDIGYNISSNIPGSFPIGDNGGGSFLFYCKGTLGYGLYLSGYGDQFIDNAEWVASSLAELLESGIGINKF